MNWKRNDRIIVHRKDDEYYLATVTVIRQGKVHVKYDDDSKDSFPIGSDSVVGRGIDEKRIEGFPKEDIDKYIGKKKDVRQSFGKQKKVKNYRHEEKRKNNPPAGLAEYNGKPSKAREYGYDPHLSPQLVWAGKPGIVNVEVEDQAGVEAETVSLHIHERISPQAIIKAVQKEEPQLDLFADPQLPFNEAVKFYQHDMDWTNRLILGDSLLVANSLIEREMMAGKVQMIYIDPPYGVKYASNFQAKINSRDVKDKDEHLTREPEQIRAYRDTWQLGVHSYLTYMRDRLRVCRELLTESGSVFVQIGDENVHLVRCLLDEVFERKNFISQIAFAKTSGLYSLHLYGICDYILWYAKDKNYLKYHQLYLNKVVGEVGATKFNRIELMDGTRRTLNLEEKKNISKIPDEAKFWDDRGLTSQGNEILLYSYRQKNYHGGWKTNIQGMNRLALAGRFYVASGSLRYLRYLDDFSVYPINSAWLDIGGIQSRTDSKIYVVQTSAKAIQRCLLMTTDPGDLVFDPTCGSGTTAYVAEQWGRRWITCDTSRVALSIARQRLMTATYPYYIINDDENDQNPKPGFKYKTVPHITLKSIANNTRIDDVAEDYNPKIEQALKELNKALKASFQEWEVPFEPDDEWSEKVKRLWKEFRDLKQAKQKKIDKIIAEDADQETLYDQPKVDNKTVRIAGTFSVEAIPPPVVQAKSEIEEPKEDLEAFDPEDTAITEDNHIPYLISLLGKDGITFPDNRKIKLDSLTARSGGIIHAEGIAEDRKYALSFGPLHGPVSIIQVMDGLREAHTGGYDEIIFCGFAFDPESQAAIRENPHPKVKAHASHIRPDILLTDSKGDSLLKTTAGSQLFTVFGEPDIEIEEAGKGKNKEYTIQLLGVDVYDPISGTVNSENAGRVAAWFIDTDYNGQTFCITQAFFPNKSAWKKIEKALKGTLDKEQFDKLTGQESLPFKQGKYKKAAVKVIDQRGNEVMKVIRLNK